MGWLRQCAGWLTRLHAGEFPQAVNLRPGRRSPGRALVAAGLPRVAAILDPIAAGIDELARARRAGDLTAAAVLPGRRAERRRRVAGPDLDFREFCRRQKVSASPERSWDAYEAERYRRGKRDTHPGYTENPFRNVRQRV